jgi:hypothetical protein
MTAGFSEMVALGETAQWCSSEDSNFQSTTEYHCQVPRLLLRVTEYAR